MRERERCGGAYGGVYLGEAAHIHVPEHVAALEGHAEQVGHVRAQRLHGGRAERHVGQRDVVQGHGHREELREVAKRYGMVTLRDSGMQGIFNGLTTADEVIRETILDA